MKYVLYRLDDNGTRHVMEESEDYEKLDRQVKNMERKAHKQTYWIESKKEQPNNETEER